MLCLITRVRRFENNLPNVQPTRLPVRHCDANPATPPGPLKKTKIKNIYNKIFKLDIALYP